MHHDFATFHSNIVFYLFCFIWCFFTLFLFAISVLTHSLPTLCCLLCLFLTWFLFSYFGFLFVLVRTRVPYLLSLLDTITYNLLCFTFPHACSSLYFLHFVLRPFLIAIRLTYTNTHRVTQTALFSFLLYSSFVFVFLACFAFELPDTVSTKVVSRFVLKKKKSVSAVAVQMLVRGKANNRNIKSHCSKSKKNSHTLNRKTCSSPDVPPTLQLLVDRAWTLNWKNTRAFWRNYQPLSVRAARLTTANNVSQRSDQTYQILMIKNTPYTTLPYRSFPAPPLAVAFAADGSAWCFTTVLLSALCLYL